MLLFAMPDQFTVAQVEAVAALARLELGHDEARAGSRSSSPTFWNMPRQVQRIDTSGVAPTASVASVARGRARGRRRAFSSARRRARQRS